MIKEKHGKRFGKVLTVSFAHLLHDIPTSFLAPILPLLIDKFGMSVFMAGLLDIFRRFPSLANPFLGLLADRMSIRYFVVIAPGTTAVTMSLLGVAPTYTFLAILLILSGISTAVFHTTGPVMMKQVSTGNIGRGMSFFMLGGELARSLGPLVILGAVSLWGLEGTWRLVPFGVMASVFIYLMLRDIRIERPSVVHGKAHTRRLLADLAPLFISLGGILLFSGAMKAALTIYLPTYLTSRGSSLWVAGISLSILQFSGVAGTLLAGMVSDRIGRKKALLLITVASPLLMWLFMVVDGVLTIPVLILNGLFLFGNGPVMLAIIHDIDSQRMSFINGIFMTLNFVLGSSMVLAAGFAADRIGLDLTYRLAAAAAAGAVLFAVFLRQPEGLKSDLPGP